MHFETEWQKEEWIKKEFPPIISEEQFELAQKKRRFNKLRSKKKHYGVDDKWMAESVVYCGECGAKFMKKKYVNKSGYIWYGYYCPWKGISEKKLRIYGRKRCIMRSFKADTIDEIIFFEITHALSTPQDFAKHWFKDVDKNELKANFENLSKQVVAKEKIIKRAYQDLSKIKNHKLREEFIKGADKDADEFDSLKKKLRKAENEYNSYQNKTDRLAKFEKALKNSNYFTISDVVTPIKGELLHFLDNLPFNEKKRIVEAVIAPENGGKCKVRYQRGVDYMDFHEFADYSNEELNEPQMDRDREPVIEMHFEMDLDRVEALITNLDRKKLLNNHVLNKRT